MRSWLVAAWSPAESKGGLKAQPRSVLLCLRPHERQPAKCIVLTPSSHLAGSEALSVSSGLLVECCHEELTYIRTKRLTKRPGFPSGRSPRTCPARSSHNFDLRVLGIIRFPSSKSSYRQSSRIPDSFLGHYRQLSKPVRAVMPMLHLPSLSRRRPSTPSSSSTSSMPNNNKLDNF